MAFLTTSILDTLNKDFIGAKQFTDRLNEFYENRAQVSSFPPYNIVEKEDGGFEIQLAVAGYDKSEISIKHEDNSLLVSGTKILKESKDAYIYCGIAARNFERKFLLRENIKIDGAEYNNGILTIKMSKLEPVKDKTKMILIT